jgi:hypothetical protein
MKMVLGLFKEDERSGCGEVKSIRPPFRLFDPEDN